MPRVDDLIDKLGHARYLTTLDLARGYWQVPMESRSREKTAFIKPKGLFKFMVIPFGLQGAPATFPAHDGLHPQRYEQLRSCVSGRLGDLQ